MKLWKELRMWLLPGLLLAACSAVAQTKVMGQQAQQMVTRIGQAAARVKTLQCRFDQVKTVSFLNDKLVSGGVMYYEDGKRLRWEYRSPYEYVLVLSEGKVHIKSGSQRSTVDVSQSRTFRAIADLMMQSMTGQGLQQNGNFGVEMFTSPGEWTARLTPKQKELKRLFSNISVCFDSKRQMVSRVELTERNGDRTVITLHDVKTNEKIDAKVFTVR